MGSKDADSRKLLGKRVEQAVSAAGYASPDEFARGIGLPRSTFFKLRRGTLDPRFSTLMKIARGLDLPISALVGDEREKNVLATDERPEPGAKPSQVVASGRPRIDRKSSVHVTLSIAADHAPAWLVEAMAQAKTQPKSKRSGKSVKAATHRG